MNIEDFRNYCLNKAGTTEETPFGPTALVFKVLGKMFAIADLESFESVSLKCNPDIAIQLREKYDAVTGGYHLNKKHWNTIKMGGFVPDDKIYHWVNHSYELVVAGLSKKQKDQLNNL